MKLHDPLLQGRLFSYLDTQLIRLGGPNFHEIPVNKPVAPVHNNQRDGYAHYAEKVEGRKVRERSPSFGDHYSQATLFWNSMSAIEKQHIVEAFHFEVGSVKDKQIRQKVVDMFNNVDGQLAAQIAQGIGAAAPAAPGGSGIADSSPAVSQSGTVMSPRTRKAAILAENGFNHSEVTQVISALQNAGVKCDIVSKNLGMLTSADNQQIEANKSFATAGSIFYDAVYVAGGRQSADQLIANGDALHFINEAFKHAKTIGAANEGVDLLNASQIQGAATAGPDTQAQLFNEWGVVTIRNAMDLGYFSGEFIKALSQHRHWEREMQLKGKGPG